jgi:hypothetical protein
MGADVCTAEIILTLQASGKVKNAVKWYGGHMTCNLHIFIQDRLKALGRVKNAVK